MIAHNNNVHMISKPVQTRSISDALRCPDFAKTVFAEIEKHLGKLPQDDIISEVGFVAGQSVASAIFTLLGLTNTAPFKDADIFCDISDLDSYDKVNIGFESDFRTTPAISDYRFGEIMSFGKNLQRGTFVDEERESRQARTLDDYKYIEKAGYQIKSVGYSTVNDKLEIILFAGSKSSRARKWRTILAGFDINAICCGIDLFTKKLYFTEAFEQFLYRPSLRVTTFYTPAKTACRLIKKQNELDFVSFDAHFEFSRIQDISSILARNEKRKGLGYQYTAGNLFGVASEKRLLSNHEDALKAFFCRENVNVQVSTSYEEDPTFTQFVTLRAKKHRWQAVERILAPYYLMLRKAGHLEQRTEEFINDISTLLDWYDFGGKKGRAKIQQVLHCVELFNQYTEQKQLDVDNWELAKDIAKCILEEKISFTCEKHIASTIKLLAPHRSLWINIHSCINGEHAILDKNLDIYRFTRCLFKAIGEREYLIGKVENSTIIISTAIQTVCIGHSLADYIDELDAEILSNLKDKIVEPVAGKAIEAIHLEQKHVEVRELCSAIDLMKEGAKQGHCVGGYFDAVKSRNSFVFTVIIRHSDNTVESATLELKMRPNEFFINQLQGKAKRRLSQELRNISAKFCEACTQHVLNTINVDAEDDAHLLF